MEDIFRITNYYDHPSDENYIVVHYLKEEQSKLFKSYLEEEKISFEDFVDTDGANPIYLFAIHRRHRRKIEHLNFLTLGKTRSPFVPNKTFRWFLILLFFLIIILSLIGYYSKVG
ncbi:MAG: hypothetical protein K1X56_00120 [Flavobacteriales bacterium]|nr:hypothetical protein [Flavobacteriales bacterium]